MEGKSPRYRNIAVNPYAGNGDINTALALGMLAEAARAHNRDGASDGATNAIRSSRKNGGLSAEGPTIGSAVQPVAETPQSMSQSMSTPEAGSSRFHMAVSRVARLMTSRGARVN